MVYPSSLGAVKLYFYKNTNNKDGSLIEQGNAWMPSNGMDWIFTATTKNEGLAGDRIVIQASGLPDNLTAQEQILD